MKKVNLVQPSFQFIVNQAKKRQSSTSTTIRYVLVTIFTVGQFDEHLSESNTIGLLQIEIDRKQKSHLLRIYDVQNLNLIIEVAISNEFMDNYHSISNRLYLYKDKRLHFAFQFTKIEEAEFINEKISQIVEKEISKQGTFFSKLVNVFFGKQQKVESMVIESSKKISIHKKQFIEQRQAFNPQNPFTILGLHLTREQLHDEMFIEVLLKIIYQINNQFSIKHKIKEKSLEPILKVESINPQNDIFNQIFMNLICKDAQSVQQRSRDRACYSNYGNLIYRNAQSVQKSSYGSVGSNNHRNLVFRVAQSVQKSSHRSEGSSNNGSLIYRNAQSVQKSSRISLGLSSCESLVFRDAQSVQQRSRGSVGSNHYGNLIYMNAQSVQKSILESLGLSSCESLVFRDVQLVQQSSGGSVGLSKYGREVNSERYNSFRASMEQRYSNMIRLKMSQLNEQGYQFIDYINQKLDMKKSFLKSPSK